METNSKITIKNNIRSEKLADFKIGVDNVIFSVDTAYNRVLVLSRKRKEQPFNNYWNLPGTLVRRAESLTDAAYRTLAEKIQVNNLYLEQLYSFGDPDRDPRAKPDIFGQLYCTILGKHFSDYSNFRSRLLKLGFLADTGAKVCRGAGRPASLYKFDSEAFAPLKDKPLLFI